MSELKMFYLTGCPYCEKAERALSELTGENPDYARMVIERVEESEHPEIAAGFDYYYVPAFFHGERKLYEAAPGQDYETVREHVRAVLDAVSAC